MNILAIISDIFFHSIIIISVYERLKLLYKAIIEYKNTNDFKKIIGEIFILSVVIIISIFLYKYFIYK
jgi:hypothetical protein